MPRAAKAPVAATALSPAGDLLAAVGGVLRTPAADIMVVVAHPDDETLGCGAQLARWRAPAIVVATDGAPRDGLDARAHGFTDIVAYGAARQAELCDALRTAESHPALLELLGIPDQQAAFNLVPLTERLAALLRERRPRLVFTHAYEGGHPDHDAVAFATHMAAGIARRITGTAPLIVEMPLYRAVGDAFGVQSFMPFPRRFSIVRWLSETERVLKGRMVAAYRSQAKVLADFALDAERFALAPAYDFREPPNNGYLYYERRGWGLNGGQWCALVRQAAARLRSRGLAC